MNKFGRICLRNYKMLTATPAVSPSLAISMEISPRSTVATEPTLEEMRDDKLEAASFPCKTKTWVPKWAVKGARVEKMQWFCNESFAQTAWCILKPTRCSRICDQGALFGPIEPLRSVQRVCWGDGSELLERPFKNRPSTNRMKQGSLNFRDGPRFQDHAS